MKLSFHTVQVAINNVSHERRRRLKRPDTATNLLLSEIFSSTGETCAIGGVPGYWCTSVLVFCTRSHGNHTAALVSYALCLLYRQVTP